MRRGAGSERSERAENARREDDKGAAAHLRPHGLRISSVVRRDGEALCESRYALSLFTPPEVWLRLGDRVTVSDKSGRVYHARASDSVRYPSHCVTVVEVFEVSVPASQESAEGGTADQEG